MMPIEANNLLLSYTSNLIVSPGESPYGTADIKTESVTQMTSFI